MKRSRCANSSRTTSRTSWLTTGQPSRARLEEDQVVDRAATAASARQPAPAARQRQLAAAEVQRRGVRARLPCVIMICIAKLPACRAAEAAPDTVPDALPLADSAASAARRWPSCSERMRDSQRPLRADRSRCCPPRCAATCRPGPIDDDGWSLLVGQRRGGRQAAPAAAAPRSTPDASGAGRLPQFGSRFNRTDTRCTGCLTRRRCSVMQIMVPACPNRTDDLPLTRRVLYQLS